MSERTVRGRVKFYEPEEGWGEIESDETPGAVWVHFSNIEGDGYQELVAGEEVEFRYEAAHQDTWNYRATWVRRSADQPEPPVDRTR